MFASASAPRGRAGPRTGREVREHQVRWSPSPSVYPHNKLNPGREAFYMQYPPSPATNAKCVHFCLQMQPLTGALPCGKGHLQSIPLERKLCFGLCHCGWLKVRRNPLFLRLSSVTGILGWIIRLSLLLLKNTRSWGESLSTVFGEITSTCPKNLLALHCGRLCSN